MNADATTENSAEPADRIVSVNSRSGAPNSIATKLGLLVLLVALAVVGCAMAAHRYWAARSATAKTNEASNQLEHPKAAPARRHFSDAAPTPSSKPTQTPPASAAVCDDGGPSQVLTAIDGKPMTAPNGQVARICQNGQLLFLQQTGAANATPTQAPMGTAVPVPTPPQAAPAPSRYGGDVLLSTAATPPQFLSPENTDSPGLATPASAPATTATTAQRLAEAPAGNQVASPQGKLKPLLQATPTAPVQATLMGDRDLILPEGRTIDCNLSLRIISEVSGMAVCVLSSAVYGDSGNVVLAEQGSVATGDYVAVSEQGQRRLFILWTRLKTPKGVLVNLNSPAADALGTSGLEGYVDNRWSERVGAAFLLSMVQDAIGYETAKATAGNGNGNAATGIAVFQNTTEAGNRLAERILNSTINIKPTIYKNQGDRASITVARDLDFGKIYALRTQ
ncbi:type IV secretion system protein VirB10 [Duganella sp. BJB1802]|uniref:type IV secretion system protein VirB10 n=1 Tax=Duganella sp. BJB1802 TaxID=2744575 RepID=UPI0015939509|nr:type IV secretion system protein VirB10 [Duganella sp. BJB1802]NVD69582.1 type IV secretion system protein VirB10 [Duganella sp. BJB1802]